MIDFAVHTQHVHLQKRGLLFVMTGASGVGKDTIRQAALSEITNVFYSISATTRTKRPGEVHGKQYYFYDKAQFKTCIDQGRMLEYAEYVGDFYGTPLEPVEKALDSGQDVLLEVELAGARQVKERMPEAIMLFIAPPSLSELERRLRGRATDSEEKIQRRLSRAREEIQSLREFDYIIVNDLVSDAVADFCGIVRAERARTQHLLEKDIAGFLREL